MKNEAKKIISLLILCFLITTHLCLKAKSLKAMLSKRNSLNNVQNDTKLSYLKNPSFIPVGYNILTGNPKMTPSSGKLIDPGYASDIFKLTYSESQQTGDRLLTYPDGFGLQITQICQANFSSQTLRTKTDLQRSIASSLGVSGSYGAYAGSLNVDFNEMSKSMSENDKMLILNEAECSIYRTHVKQYSPPPLSDNFINALKTIDGKTWENSNKEYRAFIDSFGTHYLKDTLMGSRYTYILETSNTKFSQMVDKGMNIASNARYSAFLSLSVNVNTKTSLATNNYEEFEKNISNKYVTSLGAPMPADLEMGSWFEKTKDDPMPISYSTSPITSY
jgi:hypothetical protein